MDYYHVIAACILWFMYDDWNKFFCNWKTNKRKQSEHQTQNVYTQRTRWDFVTHIQRKNHSKKLRSLNFFYCYCAYAIRFGNTFYVFQSIIMIFAVRSHLHVFEFGILRRKTGHWLFVFVWTVSETDVYTHLSGLFWEPMIKYNKKC